MNTTHLKTANAQTSSQQEWSISNWNAMRQQVEGLMARSLQDEDFRRRLVADPQPFLQEAGIHFPEGVQVCFAEDLAVSWQIVAAADSQSVMYSLRLPGEALAKDSSEERLLGSQVASLYAMYEPLQFCNNSFPDVEKNISPSVILANLEVLFFRSEGNIRMPLPTNWREQGNAVARLIAQAWTDDGFKARFMENPVPLLEEAGVSIPEGLTVEVVEGLDAPWKIVASADAQGATYSINIPAKPDDISDEDLRAAVSDRAAQVCQFCFCCV